MSGRQKWKWREERRPGFASGKHGGEQHESTLLVNYFLVSIRMDPEDAEIAGG